MRKYEYDEEAHPGVMLSNEKTARQKGCQNVDREEDIDEEDTMLTKEEELLIEQVAISTSYVQSVGTIMKVFLALRFCNLIRTSTNTV